MALIGPPDSSRAWRLNAVLSSVLVVLAIVLVNHLARERVSKLVDLSEERLAEPAPVGLELLGQLDDVLDVRAYFTGKMKIGPAQIAKRRLVDALERWEDLADGKLRLSFSDPNESTEERVEAQSLGVVSVPIPANQGGAEVRQEVFLGLRLRLGEKQAVIPWVLPQTLEQSFFSELFWMLQDAEPVLGIVSAESPDFAPLRSLFADRYAIRELTTLGHGDAVPDSIDVLLVVAPELAHPREVYEVEQFVQRGGRALFLVDPMVVDLQRAGASVRPTGYEDVLAAWGARLSDHLVWDARRANRPQLTLNDGRERRQVSFVYPPYPAIGVDGLAADSPITASVAGAALFWAAAFEGEAPEGVTRETLLSTTDAGYLVPVARALAQDAQTIQQTNAALEGANAGSELPLAVALRGKLPSAFTETAPVPMDAVREARFRDELAAATETVGPWPERAEATIPAEPLSAESEAAVVIVGDADFARKSFLEAFPASAQLLVNAVDWLALSPELLALRARLPKERAIVDFLREEREANGLAAVSVALDPGEARRLSVLEEEAQAKASRRRTTVMLATLAGALVSALALGGLARVWMSRGIPR